MIVTYKNLLESKKRGRIDKLPQLSIISSGSAANAIQHLLRKYRLPNLKVLVDYRINPEIKTKLEAVGCEIFETDLSRKVLLKDDILRLTNNKDGIDVTSDDSLGPYDIFYDWMSYEVLNSSPDYVFVPYGTGHLYENIINVAVREVRARHHDPRFTGDVEKIRQCNFIGATTNNPDSKADKLYSPHLPFVHFGTRWISLAIENGYIGGQSSVYVVQERFIEEAMELAKVNNVTCEPSGIASLALLLQMKDKLPKSAKILIVNTGKTKYES